MGKTKQQLIVDNNASFPNNNANYITPAILRDFNRDMIDNTVNQDVYTADSASFNQRIGDLASWSSSLDTNFASQTEFNSYTSSNNAKVNALIAATASFATSAITASSLTTASFAGGTMTFTKGDGSTFGVVIPDVSGSTINTGSFATTGSNTFYGDEIISGNIDVRDNIYAGYVDIRDDGGIFFRASGSNVVSGSAEYWSQASQFQVGDMVFVQQPSNDKVMSLGLDNRYVTFYKGIDLEPGFEGVDVYSTPLILSSSFGGQTEILDVKGNVSASNLNLSGALTASILEGYALVGGVGNVSKLVATSSFGGGTTIDTGSFATTGSNVFTGDQTLSDASLNTATLATISGSLVLVAKTFTSSSAGLANISASAANQVNLVFKNNNNTGTTIVSGSNNIFVNPGAATAGFNRYIGGSGNIMLNPSNVPQISGSMAFSPTLSTNYFGGNGTTLTMRGPVSSSAWTIAGNSVLGTINIGSSDANNARGIQSGLTLTGNTVAGTLSVIANRENLSSSVSITNTFLNGTAEIRPNSSSISMVNNNINDSAFTLTNNFFSSSAGQGTVTASRNNIGGQTQTITVIGSQPAGTTTLHSISDNTMLGGNNTIFIDATNARVSGSTAYFNALRNIIGGNQLIVTGSSLLADTTSFGSAYFGRFNANDGIRNKTSDIIFAVGTGTSTSNRKTGFLIDSGSNTFVEGTLNVSGSTTITGSLTISGSAQSDLTVVGQIFVSSSATGGTTTPRITVSGSAGRTVINRNSINTFDTTYEGGMFPSTIYTKDSATTFDEIGFTVAPSVFSITGWSTGPAIYINNPTDTYPAVFGFQNRANYTDGRVAVLTPLVVSSSLYIQSGSTLPASIGSSILTWNAATGQVNQASFSTIVSASVSSGEFWSTTTQSGSAGVSGSVSFNNSGSFYNVSLVNGTQLQVANAGVYNIQFSAQIETSAGADSLYIWFKKNGTNIPDSATKVVLANNTAQVMTVNILDEAAANDYYQIAYQNVNGHAMVLAEAASGNIPTIPSVIATIFQIR